MGDRWVHRCTEMCCPVGGGALHLSDLQLLNYDAVVTQEVLQPLSHLRSLSVFHLYSVPGPACHLQMWLSSLPQLCHLTVDGESEHWARSSPAKFQNIKPRLNLLLVKHGIIMTSWTSVQ